MLRVIDIDIIRYTYWERVSGSYAWNSIGNRTDSELETNFGHTLTIL